MSKQFTINPKLDFVLERFIDAPTRLVWEALTKPEHLKEWYMPKPWGRVPRTEMDVRPGGIFSIDIAMADGPEFPNLGCFLDSDGTVLLCLHKWGAHEHPSLMRPDQAQPGNGLLLFFRVDDFDMALSRARALGARLEEEPHVNPNTGTTEFSLRDPDGYYVVISAQSAVIG